MPKNQSTELKNPTPTAPPPSKSRWLKNSLIGIVVVMLLFLTSVGVVEAAFWDRIFPGVQVAGVNLSGLTREEAEQVLNQHFMEKTSQKLVFYYQEQPAEVSLEGITISQQDALNQAWTYGRTQLYFPSQDIDIDVAFTDQFEQQLTNLNNLINQPATNAQLKVDGDSISVTPSENGVGVDLSRLKSAIKTYLITGQLADTSLPTQTLYPEISYNQALAVKKSLDQIKQTPLKITNGNQSWLLDITTVTEMIDWKNSQSFLAKINTPQLSLDLQGIQVGEQQLADAQIGLDRERLVNYLKTKIAPAIDREVQEPLFQFENSRVTEFKPPVVGQKIEVLASAELINQAFINGQTEAIALIVHKQHPKNQLSNELGIQELVGQGVSHYAHSIPNRIYNVGLAASRINGVLIAPGETFSFVKTIGDISGASGYKPGYIIQNGRTVLDDGGGVCQVSTTLYRAALNAGLPIVQRTAHAYRVEYYEQGFPPGLDATIFSPTVDLKFKNDTAHSILIQTTIVGTTLTIDFYGTSDGRIVKMTTPKIVSQTPPLPEIRQDDPTLPKGTVKQVDWPAWGANVVFSRTVTRGSETLINETVRSNYRPWQAVYLVGTKEG